MNEKKFQSICMQKASLLVSLEVADISCDTEITRKEINVSGIDYEPLYNNIIMM